MVDDETPPSRPHPKSSYVRMARSKVEAVGRSASSAARSTARGAAKLPGGVSDGIGCIETGVRNKMDGAVDSVLEKQAEKIVSFVGVSVNTSLKMAGNPPCLDRAIDKWHSKMWAAAGPELKSQIMQAIGQKNKKFRGSQINFWPQRYPNPLKHPFLWFRAVFLYSQVPADCTFVMKLQNPFYVFLLLLKLSGTTVSVLVYAVYFLLTDWNDEYQMVAFILKFKGFQFLSPGIFHSITVAMGFFACLASIHTHGEEQCAISTRECNDLAPGRHHGAHSIEAQLFFELLRYTMIYYAAFRLYTGRTIGGDEAILALERVRLDLADGEIDGVLVKTSSLWSERVTKLLDKKGNASKVVRREKNGESHATLEEMSAAIREARESTGAESQRDSMLPLFMVYDVSVSVTLAVAFSVYAIARGFSEDMVGTGIYYLHILYGLLSAPFLLFSAPIFGPALHRSCPTGYDKSGLLVPKLSGGLIKRKIKAEEKALLEGEPKREGRRVRVFSSLRAGGGRGRGQVGGGDGGGLLV
uniref:Uncharacterized protein n=1 Tax=Calcidiscus leptoporus TaxID=127549 RepID=A0A7S0JGZ4_9EUKA|mmetsp:Transcript_57896/g.132997  ORF Transcript_57896/g.132997 Transcript_57896/m.132997 type:complete len:527 (+) Transcript_57896:128-1708(+)|eukprot:CAMPEP_0119366686 /NCGR_PEP_ID=MMETSP1334-20130426/13522_1 /TAXON_ID=127549 /ORGANISM="Calcidiscus leptoporus, Strain RCC1130" /LENGTH=526 /DNA_ID=CAMNT_0007382945 /DNA_START=125 /DNA_END=1705 /DNA_ORIENTATION=-